MNVLRSHRSAPSRRRCLLNTFFAALALAAATPGVIAEADDGPPRSTTPLAVHPAPVLSPWEAIQSFQIPDGFEVQLVAAEPLVQDPVAMVFGPDGRIWVVEMSDYMPNLEGEGENQPTGKVVVLDDRDGDGQMDHRTVFLDNLVLPRAVSLVADGVLVAEPPHLWFCRDTNGDGVADEKKEITYDYGAPGNPEHTANGLLWAIDNWIYSANHDVRFRYDGGAWHREATPSRGQWGISQDNHGRLFYNSNSVALRADLLPADYMQRNRNLEDPAGVGVLIAETESTFPAFPTPGINRGYRLGPDKKLPSVTAACGPAVYRGSLFGAEFDGNVFVCEPAGNLVQRYLIEDTPTGTVARNAYFEQKREFLDSPDERFRPVNALTGPDGALYIVDMYRGLIEHRIFLTGYLSDHVKARALEQPLRLGRIYRIVRKGAQLFPRPALAQADTANLIATLAHPNGWWRDTAQRLLVERRDPAAAPALRELLAKSANPLARLHALWTLEGLDALDDATIQRALNDADANVRDAGIRIAGHRLEKASDADVVDRLLAILDGDDLLRRTTAAMALTNVATPEITARLVRLLRENPDQPWLRDAVISGYQGRELELLEPLLAGEAAQKTTVSRLTECVIAERKAAHTARLLGLLASKEQPAWARTAILDGFVDALPAKGKESAAVKLKLAVKPEALLAIAADQTDPLSGAASKLLVSLTWPGHASDTGEAPVVKLTRPQKLMRERGGKTFLSICAACHQPNGMGLPGVAKRLVGSPWVLGPDEALIRIVLDGKHSDNPPMTMPPLASLDDLTIASVLTYIRREWGHKAAPVEVSTVTEVRRQVAGRTEPWTDEELKALFGIESQNPGTENKR